MEKELLLTITMLVSDRTETIEKCMKSLKSLLERVPSELIVVDTAGNKMCLEVVRQYADKIIPFEWCNDFSKARNTGLKEARGQWVMFLDDDEWFESTKEIEEFFLKGIYKQYRSASYITRNYSNKQGTKWDDRIALRLCCRNKGLCFRGKIHEYLYPACKPTYRMKDYVHHYGYVFENEEEKQEHAWRNIRPLLEQRKEDPDNLHTASQLLQEYIALGESYSALEVACAISNHPMRYFEAKERYTAYAQVMEIRLYMNMRKYEVAYERAQSILKEKEILLLTKGCISGLMVGICAILKKYEEALKHVKQYLKYEKEWREADLRYTDLFNMEMQFLNANEARRMELIKLNLHIKLAQWEEADRWFKQIVWYEPWNCMVRDTARDLIKVFLYCDNEPDSHPAYKEAIEAVIKYENLRKILYAEIEKLSKEEKDRILSFIVLLEPTDINLLHFHWEYYWRINNKSKIKVLLELMKEKGFSFLDTHDAYWKCLDGMNLEIDSYIKGISIKEYFTQINTLYIKCELETCEIANRVLWKNISAEDIRYKYVKGMFLEKKFLKEAGSLGDREIWKYFFAISEYWYSCAKDLYRFEVFDGELLSALPSRYQFAWHIICAEKSKDDISIFSKNIVAAGKCYTPMSSLVVRYLRYIQEEKKRQAESNKISPEMKKLAEQIKEKVRVLINLNQLKEAMAVIEQLETFVPDDEDLYQLKSVVQKGME